MSVLEEDAVVASETAPDDRLVRWRVGFEEMFASVAGEFAQAQSRWRARWYLLGLLSGAERKNSWTIAEQAGDLSPDGMQRLLNHYVWDADAVRDHLQSYVLGHLADPVTGVVVADETGFLKKGVKSAGVQRQYSGTAGRIENCQIGVFLTYVSARGRALIDRELYLPKSWTNDRDRCAEAGIDDEIEFATKPVLARRMLERLIAAHGKQAVGWFTADEAYGDNPELRDWLEDRDINYVMAMSCDQRFATPTGPRRADELARAAPKTGWQRFSAGTGSKGHRLDDWLLIDPGTDTHLLLVRRSISKPDELAYYVVYTTAPVPLAELVRVAGSRWAMRKPSSSPRTRPDWTTTKSASTTPGIDTSPSPCSPQRFLPSLPTPSATAIKRGRRQQQHRATNSLVLQRDPPPLGHPHPPQPAPNPHQPLVHLATSPPNPRPPKPLPATTDQTSQATAVVLGAAIRWCVVR